MFKRRKSFNPKRSVDNDAARADLERWAREVRYGGNPEHKKYPAAFGLRLPSRPRPDKSLCEGIGVSTSEQAAELLRSGVLRGLVSKQLRSGYPQNIWSVTDEGHAVEAQLETPKPGHITVTQCR